MYCDPKPFQNYKNHPWSCDPENIVPSPSRDGDPNYVSDQGGIFREIEKKYAGKDLRSKNGKKRRRKKPAQNDVDLSDVVDFSNLANNTPENLANIVEIPGLNSTSPYFSANPKVYTLKNVPGLYVIPNPFTPSQQRFWVRKCIQEYTLNNPTNVSNLEAIESGNTKLRTEWTPEVMEGLRWASVGYHFQWTPRVYTEEHRGVFPAELGEFVHDAAALIGHSEMRGEAAIINFYSHSKCMMGGHLDNAEEDMSQPIVSTSFGNTVVFLIGGRTRDVVPTAIYIKSGDIVLMAGEARHCFHGVPRMLKETVPAFLQLQVGESEQVEEEGWSQELTEYMKDARININARQVRIEKKELKNGMSKIL